MSHRLRALLCPVLAFVAVAFACPPAGEARADLVPFAGVEALAAFPTSSAQDATRPGGAVRVNGGYRLPLGSSYALSLVGDGGVTLFESHCGDDVRICTDDDVATLLSLTVGPRLSLVDGGLELFFGARGGVYRGVSAGLSETAAGWLLETGAVYTLVEGTTAGLSVRREQLGIEPSRDGGDFEFISFGLAFEHRFTPPPKAVSHPRPRPDF